MQALCMLTSWQEAKNEFMCKGNSANDQSFQAILGGVIASVILVLLCLLGTVLRYMYRHKGTYHTNEAKGTEFAETADAALKNDPSLQDAVDENKKEYFI
ncbi:glycophorin-C isoform X2 [Anguilla anguilla]|uniref:glycophorin-C isoform X2 n=1 Tax=Anguilla anguilla TaxID=7936 RepID=UPI0015B21878|nr:glycophorin-C isoform X2 [Anguilla anguilla]